MTKAWEGEREPRKVAGRPSGPPLELRETQGGRGGGGQTWWGEYPPGVYSFVRPLLGQPVRPSPKSSGGQFSMPAHHAIEHVLDSLEDMMAADHSAAPFLLNLANELKHMHGPRQQQRVIRAVRDALVGGPESVRASNSSRRVSGTS